MLAGQAATKQVWDGMPMVQIRESRRVKGDYIINELDVNALRTYPDVMNEGYAAGYIAALCLQNNTLPRDVDVKALQRHMVEVDILPKEDIEHITQEFPEPTNEDLAKAAHDPSVRANLLTLARGGDRSIKPLRLTFKERPDLAKAKALCLLGESAGVPLLAQWLDKQPIGKGPGYDWEGFLNVPEIDSVMWLMGIPQDGSAVPALVKKLEEYQDDCGFNRIRALTMALGRIGDPSAAKPLAEFLKRPGVSGHMDVGQDPSTILAPQFSKAMIELFAASALYRCGDCQPQWMPGYSGQGCD